MDEEKDYIDVGDEFLCRDFVVKVVNIDNNDVVGFEVYKEGELVKTDARYLDKFKLGLRDYGHEAPYSQEKHLP